MKKLICALLVILLLIPAASVAEEAPLDFARLTGLDKAQELLDSGETIDKIYYTDGYGFSTSEFVTTDGVEIAQLWKAVNAITIVGETPEDITDWYPQIVFFFSDESRLNICFDAHWLEIGMDHYLVANDEAFWSLTAALTAAYAFRGGEPEPDWGDYYASVALTVDDIEFTPQELEEAMRCHLIQSVINVSDYGYEYDITDRDNIIDTLDKVLFDLEIRAVIQEQAEEMGLDDLTEEDYDGIWNEMEEEWQRICEKLISNNIMARLPAGNYYRAGDDAEANITRYLASFGLTKETIFDDLYHYALEKKLKEAVTKDMEDASEDEKRAVYTDWLLERFWEADIHENGVGIAEVCFRLIP